jgi:hypothetical protein
MNDQQYKPVILPIIKNACKPISLAEMMDTMDLEEENKKMWAKINELMAATGVKVAIEHRDGSVQVLDDASKILEESFKDLKQQS